MPAHREQSALQQASQRLAWLRDHLWNGSQVNMANEMKIHQGSLSNLLNGKRVPGYRLLNKIAQHPRINRTWLLTGEGRPLIDMTVVPESSELALPVARIPFDGLPIENSQCLERFLLPVHRSLYRPSRYWVPITAEHALTLDASLRLGRGDWVLFEPDTSYWPQNLDGHPCLVELDSSNNAVLKYAVAVTGGVDKSAAHFRICGSTTSRERERVVLIDKELSLKQPLTTPEIAIRLVAVGIHKEGSFGSVN